MLRAVPSYFGTPVWGVIVMVLAVVIFFVLPWLDSGAVRSIRYRGPYYKGALALFVISFLVLGYLGVVPVTIWGQFGPNVPIVGGVDVATFVARHVGAVARLMATAGLAADAEAMAAYGDFAAHGGEISLGGEYGRPLAGRARDGGALAWMDASLEHNGRRLPVRWHQFEPRPLPGGGKAVRAVLAADGGSPGAAPAKSAAAISRGDGIISHANLISPGSTVGWDDLGALQGRWIQVWTAHNAPRHVMVLGMDRGQLQVRARLGGGHADYRITREAFLRARLVQ